VTWKRRRRAEFGTDKCRRNPLRRRATVCFSRWSRTGLFAHSRLGLL